MILEVEGPLRERFEGLLVKVWEIQGLRIREVDEELEKLKREVEEEIRSRFTLETLKDYSVFRAYRDFYWRIGIDPTKDRPAGEALVRRILSGKNLPTINTAVDCYNLASAQTGVAMGAYDTSKLGGKLVLRMAKPGEEFLGIGFSQPIKLKGGEPVISDGEKIVAIYPYRDSELTKIRLETTEITLLSCGVPGLDPGLLDRAGNLALSYLKRFCV